MVIQFIEHLLNRIRERQSIYSQRICSGNVVSFEDYKGIVGKLQGLMEAEEEIRDLCKKWDKSVSI